MAEAALVPQLQQRLAQRDASLAALGAAKQQLEVRCGRAGPQQLQHRLPDC
jgi:hypothetical protein